MNVFPARNKFSSIGTLLFWLLKAMLSYVVPALKIPGWSQSASERYSRENRSSCKSWSDPNKFRKTYGDDGRTTLLGQ